MCGNVNISGYATAVVHYKVPLMMTISVIITSHIFLEISYVPLPPHTQLCYSSLDFVRDNPGEPVREETFTHSNLSWSLIVPYLLHTPTMIHGILPIESMCLIVFFQN